MTRTLLVFTVLSTACLEACGRAQPPPLPGDSVSPSGHVTLETPRFSAAVASRPSMDPPGPIESQLFPADLVFEHQAAIALENPQRAAIEKQVRQAEQELVGLQLSLDQEKEKLVNVLAADSIVPKTARDQADRVMALESRIKSAHLSLLVQIKNELHPAQQAALRVFRDAERCGGGGSGLKPDAGG